MTKRQEKEAEYIQSLSVAQLKELEKNFKWVKFDLSEETNDTDFTMQQHDDYIESLSIVELRAYASNLKRIVVQIDEDASEYNDVLDYKNQVQNFAAAEPQTPYGIEAKMQKTGLTKAQILTIENDKTQATVSEIMRYCKGLEMPYAHILPEFFVA